MNPDEVADDDNVASKAVFTVIPTERDFTLTSLSTAPTAANSPLVETLKQGEASTRNTLHSSKFLNATTLPENQEVVEVAMEEIKYDQQKSGGEVMFALDQNCSSPGKRGRKSGGVSTQGTGYLSHFNGKHTNCAIFLHLSNVLLNLFLFRAQATSITALSNRANFHYHSASSPPELHRVKAG